MILKQKISDELFARDIKINMSITAEITKIKNEIANDLSSRDRSFTAEIERILNTKIANELFARLFKINITFTRSLTESIIILIINLTKKLMRGSAKLI